jgi:hypothetical protein
LKGMWLLCSFLVNIKVQQVHFSTIVPQYTMLLKKDTNVIHSLLSPSHEISTTRVEPYRTSKKRLRGITWNPCNYESLWKRKMMLSKPCGTFASCDINQCRSVLHREEKECIAKYSIQVLAVPNILSTHTHTYTINFSQRRTTISRFSWRH